MEVFTPLDNKGSSPSRSITKMHEISINHQIFIDQILQALLKCNPQNSDFTNQITKIQNDFKKTIEENDLSINNEKAIVDSINKFVETSEENISYIKIDIDRLNKVTNENSEVLTNIRADLQSFRDDFELFRMKRTTSLSPRKKNDQSDIEKVKLDVESLKNALEVVNENYAPEGSLKDSLNDIKKLNDITKKLEDSNFQEQIQNLSKLQQELDQKETQQAQQISAIGNAQNAQESQIKQSIQQMNDLKSQLNDLKNSFQQIDNLKLQIDNLKNSIQQNNNLKSQVDDLKNSIQQIDNLKLQIDNLKNSIQQNNNLKSQVDDLKNSIQQINDLKLQTDNLKNSIQQNNNLKSQVDDLKNSIQQINDLQSQLNDLKRAIQQFDDIKPQLEDLKNSMVQTRDIPILTDNSDMEIINQRLDQISDSQAKTDQTINSLNSNLKEQQSKYLDPLISRVNKVEEVLNDTSKLDDQLNEIAKLQDRINRIEQNQNMQPQSNVVDRDQILSITPEISNIDSMSQQINDLSSSQNKIMDAVDALNSKLEEQQNKYSDSLSDRISRIEEKLNEFDNLPNNGLNKNEILQIPEISDAISMRDHVNEIATSQNKTTEEVNALKSKFEEQQAKLPISLADKVNQIEEQLNELENIQPNNNLDKEEILRIPEISDAISMKDLINEIAISQNKTIEAFNTLKSRFEEQQTKLSDQLIQKVNQIEEQLNELENIQPSNGLDKEEILRIPEISDAISMRDLVNEIVISQNKTIEAVNALKAKFEEQQTKLSDPIIRKINQIEEQLNQLESLPLNSANNDDNDYRISLLEEKISNLENPEIKDISSIKDRLDELAASQNKTIETVNSLNSRLHEQQARYDQKLAQKVGQIEDQLNQEIENVQERDIQLEGDDNLNELQQSIDLLSSNQKEAERDLRSHKNRLNKLDDQMAEISSKLDSIESEQAEKKKFSLASLLSDNNEEEDDDQNDDANADSKLRRRVSKLEKIVAHLMPAEQLKMKMIPIDFVDEIDIENETTDETLRRHNREISVLAKDLIVLSNEVIDLQGDLNEMKFKGGRKPVKQSEEEQIENESQNKKEVDLPNSEDLEVLKDRVNEIACCYSKLQEMNNQMLPHIKKNRSDINVLYEKQKSLESQLDQIESEDRQYNDNNNNNNNFDSDVEVQERHAVVSSDLSDDVSALKERLDEIASAYIALQNLNNALVDHTRKNEADISLLMARQNQMEEQNSQSEHEHSRRVKRVKKYHHRSRRRLNEEEDENENENENDNENEDANENENEDDNDNENNSNNEDDEGQANDEQNQENDEQESNQALTDEVINRLNVVSSNNAKLFDICKALKSHIEKQHEELASIPKMSSDIRCIKHELRKLLNLQEDEDYREPRRIDSRSIRREDDDEDEDEDENEKITKMSRDIRCIKHELKKLINSQDDDDDGQAKSNLNDIQSALNSIVDSQSDVINTANTQTQRIQGQQDQLNKQLSAIRALDQKIADHKEQLQQLSNVQDELARLNEEIENLKDDQNTLKNQPKIKERSIDPQVIPDDLANRLDSQEQEMREILSRCKLLVDTSNGHSSYIKSQNAVINEMNTEMRERAEDYENRLEKLEYSMKCLKYEIRKLKFDPKSAQTVVSSSISDEKVNDFEEALNQMADRMSNLIENSNIHSERIQKQQHQINQQTAAIRCIVENKDKYNLLDKMVGGSTSSEISQIHHEIDQIKQALRNNNDNKAVTQRSITPPSENDNIYNDDDFRNLEQKVNNIEKAISNLKSPSGITSEEDYSRVDQMVDHINRLEASQNIIIQNANGQNSHISRHQSQISQIEAKIGQIEKQLELTNDSPVFDSDTSFLTQKVDQLSNSIDDLSNRLDMINQELSKVQQQAKLTAEPSLVNDNCGDDVRHSIQSLKSQIKIIEQKLKSNFIKINDAHEQISDRFDKVSKDIKSLKDSQKNLMMHQKNQTQDFQQQIQDRDLSPTSPAGNQNESLELADLSSEFAEFKKNQIDLNRYLKKLIEDTAQSASAQIQNAVNLVRNELNQRSPKIPSQSQDQNQNPNAAQSDFFSLKKEIDTLKISEIRKEISSLKNEQKRIQSTLSKSSTPISSASNEEKVRIEAISKKVNQMKDELTNLSSKIQKNDEFVKNELDTKSQQLTSNTDEIDEAKKLANRIVKIVKGHDEKLKKLKDHIDYQNGVLSEITGREIRMASSRPTTPK